MKYSKSKEKTFKTLAIITLVIAILLGIIGLSLSENTVKIFTIVGALCMAMLSIFFYLWLKKMKLQEADRVEKEKIAQTEADRVEKEKIAKAEEEKKRTNPYTGEKQEDDLLSVEEIDLLDMLDEMLDD